jgi:hypothetical protein
VKAPIFEGVFFKNWGLAEKKEGNFRMALIFSPFLPI